MEFEKSACRFCSSADKVIDRLSMGFNSRAALPPYVWVLLTSVPGREVFTLSTYAGSHRVKALTLTATLSDTIGILTAPRVVQPRPPPFTDSKPASTRPENFWVSGWRVTNLIRPPRLAAP